MYEFKKLIVAEVLRVIRSMLATAQEGRKNAIEESRYHKGAMESRYDTFKEEAQYLMSAQDLRIGEMNSTIAVLESLLTRPNIQNNKIGVFSLVELEDEAGISASYLILPVGGGVTCSISGRKITTINEASPLARVLFGKSEEEEAELTVAGITKILSIISIS